MSEHLDGAAMVAEAREWLGTPWHHQAPLKGIGCDCTGLVRGVINAFRPLPPELQQMDYARTPDGVTLLRLCREHLHEVAIADIAPGDVLAFRYDRDPQHMAIAADYVHGGLSMIHALDQRGRSVGNSAGRVVEHRIDTAWQRRIVAAFRVPACCPDKSQDLPFSIGAYFGGPKFAAVSSTDGRTLGGEIPAP